MAKPNARIHSVFLLVCKLVHFNFSDSLTSVGSGTGRSVLDLGNMRGLKVVLAFSLRQPNLEKAWSTRVLNHSTPVVVVAMTTHILGRLAVVLPQLIEGHKAKTGRSSSHSHKRIPNICLDMRGCQFECIGTDVNNTQ